MSRLPAPIDTHLIKQKTLRLILDPPNNVSGKRAKKGDFSIDFSVNVRLRFLRSLTVGSSFSWCKVPSSSVTRRFPLIIFLIRNFM
ncbi:MAG: hypothetical protein ABSC91_08035 [Candidatus Bathyarchaeia archaeon]